MAPRISLPGCRVYARTVSLTRGQQVEVDVAGDGSSDLDLLVIDPKGVAVAVDMTDLDTFVTRFRALANGRYEFRVINQGHQTNRFRMTVWQLATQRRWWQRWPLGVNIAAGWRSTEFLLGRAGTVEADQAVARGTRWVELRCSKSPHALGVADGLGEEQKSA